MTSKLKRTLARRRWRASHAELVLQALADSGLSVAAFAREHGVKVERLRRWPRRLRLLDQGSEAGEAGPDRAAAPITLVPVQILGSLERAEPPPREPRTHAARALDVSIGSAVVHVPTDFDADHLRRVVAALASSC